MILFQRLSKKEKDKCAEVKESRSLLSEMCRAGLLDGLVEDYISLCNVTDKETGTKAKSTKARFANLAGLCRYMGTGLSDLAGFKNDFPEEYDKLLAIFEDEALNATLSPTLLSAYLKKRLYYAAAVEERGESKEVSYCFEHDIFTDGE